MIKNIPILFAFLFTYKISFIFHNLILSTDNNSKATHQFISIVTLTVALIIFQMRKFYLFQFHSQPLYVSQTIMNIIFV